MSATESVRNLEVSFYKDIKYELCYQTITINHNPYYILMYQIETCFFSNILLWIIWLFNSRRSDYYIIWYTNIVILIQVSLEFLCLRIICATELCVIASGSKYTMHITIQARINVSFRHALGHFSIILMKYQPVKRLDIYFNFK